MLRGYGSGAVDFLFKPLNPAILRSKVRVFLELHAAHQKVEDAKTALELSNAELRSLASEKASLAEQFRVANVALQAAYTNLQSTHAQLVQSAKMASLGELVAGVAHENQQSTCVRAQPLGYGATQVESARTGATGPALGLRAGEMATCPRAVERNRAGAGTDSRARD